MSSLPNLGLSMSRAKYANRHDFNLFTPPSDTVASELRSTPDQDPVLTRPATRAASYQPSEGSGMTLLGAIDDASSVTLQDEFPWHEVGVNKSAQKIPSTIAPALLQGISNAFPSRSSLNGEEGGSCQVDEDSSDSGDAVPRYSASQKGKWKAQADGDAMCGIGLVGSLSPQFHFDDLYNSVEGWAAHNTPILQDYANRQVSLPLGRRLEVSIDEPPQFILGAIQLLVNRDQRGCTDHSRQLGPQLIENFVDIDRWAKEYFRSRHGTQVMDSDVPALLTIVMNNFYEGQVQLIDRLVEFALENMRFCGRSSLGIEDFAFGFDFRMSQDLPFYVETASRIRKPLPIRAVEVRPTSQPVTTNSGRQVKLTERAKAASEQASGRRNKGKNTSEVKNQQAANASVPPTRQNKKPAQPPSQRTEVSTTSQGKTHVAAPVPPKTTAELTKYRAIRPSNLRLPPVAPSTLSAGGITPLQLDGGSKLEPGASASVDSPKVSGSLGSNLTVDPPPRQKITLPPLKLLTSMAPATSGSGSTAKTTNRMRGTTCSGPARPRGPRNGRGRGRGQGCRSTSLTPSAEAPEATADSPRVLPTVDPVDAGDPETSAAIKPPVGSSTAVDARKSLVGPTTRARSRGIDSSVSTRDDDPSTSRRARTGQTLLSLTDPGHSKGKKRKLEDCED